MIKSKNLQKNKLNNSQSDNIIKKRTFYDKFKYNLKMFAVKTLLVSNLMTTAVSPVLSQSPNNEYKNNKKTEVVSDSTSSANSNSNNLNENINKASLSLTSTPIILTLNPIYFSGYYDELITLLSLYSYVDKSPQEIADDLIPKFYDLTKNSKFLTKGPNGEITLNQTRSMFKLYGGNLGGVEFIFLNGKGIDTTSAYENSQSQTSPKGDIFVPYLGLDGVLYFNPEININYFQDNSTQGGYTKQSILVEKKIAKEIVPKVKGGLLTLSWKGNSYLNLFAVMAYFPYTGNLSGSYNLHFHITTNYYLFNNINPSFGFLLQGNYEILKNNSKTTFYPFNGAKVSIYTSLAFLDRFSLIFSVGQSVSLYPNTSYLESIAREFSVGIDMHNSANGKISIEFRTGNNSSGIFNFNYFSVPLNLMHGNLGLEIYYSNYSIGEKRVRLNILGLGGRVYF
jgi:hypothetical protein